MRFIEIITLYDQHDNEIGSIYPRRAKQLVLKGRADWLEEGRTLKMNPSSPATEENETMIESIQTNDGIKTVTSEADSLLMNQAMQNVKERKILIKHILVYIAGWFLLVVMADTIFYNTQHPSARTGQTISRDLRAIRVEDASEISAIQQATYFIEYHTGSGYTPPVFYVLLGVMLTWGGWIAVRVGQFIAKRPHTFFIKRFRPDPVLREYNRLKRMSSDEIM